MNKIQLEDVINVDKNIQIDKDTSIFITNSNTNINIEVINNSNVFVFISSSSISFKVNTRYNLILNIFSINSSISSKVDISNDNIELKYVYSTINEIDNKYKVEINHLGNNIKSNITSHGINLGNNLSFDINARVPKSSVGVITNQDSKIILEDGQVLIKPNLLVDIDNISANHSAYIGEFKEEEIFYLKSRGLDENSSKKLLAKSFLLGQMDITFRERNIILDILKRYWR